MLTLVSKPDELDFLSDDAFSAVISSLIKTYGTEYDFAKFYIQENHAALSIIDGNINIFADKSADFEEIAEFLRMMGFESERGEEWIFNFLGLERSDSSFIVKYCDDEKAAPPNFYSSFEYKEVYNLLSNAGFELGDYESFLLDVCARVNKGAASLGCIADDKLRSCCFRLFEGNKSVLLGAVATDKESRGKGYASALVPYMADKNKPSYLFTRNDGLVEFYKNCGFEPVGKWAISYAE